MGTSINAMDGNQAEYVAAVKRFGNYVSEIIIN